VADRNVCPPDMPSTMGRGTRREEWQTGMSVPSGGPATASAVDRERERFVHVEYGVRATGHVLSLPQAMELPWAEEPAAP
jgi:hypothetical protein